MELLLTRTQDDDPASHAAAPAEPVSTAAPARGAAPCSRGVQHEAAQWSVLVDMGFDRDQAITALQEAHGDVEAALLLLSESEPAAPAAGPMGGSNYSVSKKLAAMRPADIPDERRFDASDGNAYDLDSFIDVYGGSRIAPPDEWFSAAPVSATPNTHACMLGTLLASDADALSEQLGTLADMGFPRDAALAALRKSDGNVQAALQELFG